MGREFHEHSDDAELNSYHPGCIGGIFNVLGYHHWYDVKKMFPHRKYNKGRHARCCANPQTISMERGEPSEIQGLLGGEEGQIQVQQQTRKTGSTNKSSGKAKASTKGLTGKEKHKEGNHKHWVLGFSARPESQQTDSTPHPEPSGFGLGWINPIILVQKRADTSESSSTSSLPEAPRRQVTRSKKHDIHGRMYADNDLERQENSGKQASGSRTLINQKLMAKKLKKQVSDNQVKDGVDVLEIFKVNKDLFLDILQDPEVGISQHFPGKQISKTVKLTKSGSYPVPDSPRTRYLRSSTLEHKQKEVWSFRKGEQTLTGTQLSKSKALRTDDCSRSIMTKEASSLTQGSDSQRWNHLVMNRFKYIKQRIKQALGERRKSISHRMVGGHTHQVSSSNTLPERLEKTTMEQDTVSNFNGSLQPDASDHDTRNGRLNRIRRTKSINESLDRYARLFEHGVSKESDLHHSKSLKLSNEDKVPSSDHVPKFFRRISSLSDLESFCSLLHEVYRDAFSSEMPIKSTLNCDANKEFDAHNEPKSVSFPEETDKFELVEAVLEAELQENLTEGNNLSSTSLSVDGNREEIAKPCDINEDIFELPLEKSSPHQEQESVHAVNRSRERTQPTSDLSDLISKAERQISEGLGLNRPNLPEGEASFPFFKDRRISRESVEYETMGISRRFLIIESDKEADPCYNYVRDILELSGFIQNKYLQTWYLTDQPLNPSLFRELETLFHPELECSIEEVGSICGHQLIFDLVNEAILEISEQSSIYFPKPFFNSRISRMLEGNNILQEVWTKVSRTLASQPESDQSLDDIIAQDLAKDAWMNLQTEAGFVALELEDLVFDELLDEVLCL